ncbi:MAG: dinitrogenase iron-molybdenum cofactor biosynthesis protein [Deltaproteobacteria bacterium]|nr:NifB/NifX family molybdenum-iron cluster-binding protein [Deltaproteobacteria bacterium]TSA13078.1 MAG: dinitrogenase iron-molybdenum cofactor biosynthesis protein [Deltaproteobacteria bacterium]
MKIAISAKGKGLDDEIDPRFGRAAYFIIVDPETMEFKAVDNTKNIEAMQGAGIQAARTVAEEGAGVLITGHCGPKAFVTLQAAKINVAVNVSGTVGEAIEKFKRGEISYTKAPNVEGHWR